MQDRGRGIVRRSGRARRAAIPPRPPQAREPPAASFDHLAGVPGQAGQFTFTPNPNKTFRLHLPGRRHSLASKGLRGSARATPSSGFRERFMRVRSIVLPAVVGLSALASPALAGGCVNCYRHVVTPPVYGSVAQEVMVRAPRTVAHAIPGEYGSVAETVLVSPPRKVWQVARGPHGEAIGCWVVILAQFAVRHRTVEVRPPQVVHETIPAAYATHHRTVVVEPGSSGWQPIGGGFGGHGGYGHGNGGYGNGGYGNGGFGGHWGQGYGGGWGRGGRWGHGHRGYGYGGHHGGYGDRGFGRRGYGYGGYGAGYGGSAVGGLAAAAGGAVGGPVGAIAGEVAADAAGF